MLNPTMPERVGALTPLSSGALRLVLVQAHLLLAGKLPLPEADREQWCMRLDAAVQSHNQLVGKLEVADAWAIQSANQTLVVDGRSYTGDDALQFRDDLYKRAQAETMTLLSLGALLILDDRARHAAAASPAVCQAGAIAVTPAVTPNPSPVQPESEIVAQIRRERAGALLPTGTLP